MKTTERKISLNAPGATVREVKEVVTFRAKPSEVAYWDKALNELGVHEKDKAAFMRGAMHSAIWLSQRAKDPDWQKFVEAVQGLAKKFLGHGFYDGGAQDIVSRGTDHKGLPAEQVFSDLQRKYKIP